LYQAMPGLTYAPALSYAAAPGAAAPASAPATVASGKDHGFFHDLLDVINPLQHLPVVGTLYRAITGDVPGRLEKLAGDTLYGGLFGAVGSVADMAFESITGKDFGSTVLSLFTGDDKPQTAIAAADHHFGDSLFSFLDHTATPSTAPVAVAVADAAKPAPLPDSFDVAALSASLSDKGVDNDTASRALYAYRRSMGAAQTSQLASVH
jgi:hypothetical protein